MNDSFTLRPYQQKAYNAIIDTWSCNTQSTLLVLPTGAGKTIVIAAVVEHLIAQGERVLILAHREELLSQASDKIRKATGIESALEKAKDTCIDSLYPLAVGSVQTLQSQKRLDRFPVDFFDTIIIDEAHHAVSTSYKRILNHFHAAKRLGVTATADRGDRRNLGEVFQTIAYEYTLPEAIRSNYLVPIKALTLPVKINLGSPRVQAGDYVLSELDSKLTPYLEAIADEISKHCKDRKTIIFLPLVATSQKMQGILQAKGFRCGEVNCNSIDRKETLEKFSTGEYTILCNSMLLTEGFDEPSVDCIVCLRPTKVRALYAQIVGRGTRLNPPNKTHLLLLDFLWNTDTHDLCRPAHLINKNTDLQQRIDEIIEEQSTVEKTGGGGVDILQIEADAESTAQQEREEALAKLLEERRKSRAKLVDPIQYEYSIGKGSKVDHYEPDVFDLTAQQPPTQAQIDALEKYGINPESIDTFGKASKMIELLKKRRDGGYASPKQIRILERFGFEHVAHYTTEKANSFIAQIAANNWRIPSRLNPKSINHEFAQELARSESATNEIDWSDF